jgi:uncharacterized RDD family membrane protein YckC
MINEYYLLRGNQQNGPYSYTELMDMGISVHEMILSPLARDWREATDLPEFDEYFKSIGVFVPTKQNVANFGWRLLAFVIDYALLIIGIGLVIAVLTIAERLTKGTVSDTSSENDLLFRIVFVLVLIFYNTIFKATIIQGSIGKVICKLIVVDVKGQRLSFKNALQRNLSKLLSSFLFCLGFFAMLWNPRKQCWHDQTAKAYVVRKTK